MEIAIIKTMKNNKKINQIIKQQQMKMQKKQKKKSISLLQAQKANQD